jgi:hypothetical protein
MADVSSNLYSWSTTASSNSPSGVTNVGSGLDDNLRQLQATVREGLAHYNSVAVASAGTVDLGAQTGNFLIISGTTTITSFGTVSAGIWKVVRFSGALLLTHNGTSLILPGAANITTVAGDVACFLSEGSGNWRCVWYQPVDSRLIGSAVTITSTDAGASVGPTLTLYRDSATPAANDLMGTLAYQGEDSAGNATTYSQLYATISDPTNGSEDGLLSIQTVVAGTVADRVSIGQGLYTTGSSDGGTNTISTGALSASSVAGSCVADQATVEAASSTSTIVTPGNTKYHPGVAKYWCKVTYSGGTPSIAGASQAGGSVTDNGTAGDTTVNLPITFSSTNTMCPLITPSAARAFARTNTITTSTIQVVTQNDVPAAQDIDFFLVVFGDL